MTTFVASYTRLSIVLLVMTQGQYLRGSRQRRPGSTRQMRPMTPVYDERDVGPGFNHADWAARMRLSDVCVNKRLLADSVYCVDCNTCRRHCVCVCGG